MTKEEFNTRLDNILYIEELIDLEDELGYGNIVYEFDLYTYDEALQTILENIKNMNKYDVKALKDGIIHIECDECEYLVQKNLYEFRDVNDEYSIDDIKEDYREKVYESNVLDEEISENNLYTIMPKAEKEKEEMKININILMEE